MATGHLVSASQNEYGELQLALLCQFTFTLDVPVISAGLNNLIISGGIFVVTRPN